MNRWYDAPGRVMCCLCFEQTLPVDLYVCSHKQKWDCCKPCGRENGCFCD